MQPSIHQRITDARAECEEEAKAHAGIAAKRVGLVPAQDAKRLPFGESPGEVAQRVQQALRGIGSVLTALRCVFIEVGATLVPAQGGSQ